MSGGTACRALWDNIKDNDQLGNSACLSQVPLPEATHRSFCLDSSRAHPLSLSDTLREQTAGTGEVSRALPRVGPPQNP